MRPTKPLAVVNLEAADDGTDAYAARSIAPFADLATRIIEVGRHDEAQKRLRAAAALSERVHGRNHHSMGVAATRLGLATYLAGEPSLALPHQRRELAISSGRTAPGTSASGWRPPSTSSPTSCARPAPPGPAYDRGPRRASGV